MAGLPPPPINDKPGSFTWLEWYRQLRNYVSTSGSVPWYILNFSGSNITDIALREHNQLQGLQGGGAGEMFHLNVGQMDNLLTDQQITDLLSTTEKSTLLTGVYGSMYIHNSTVTRTIPVSNTYYEVASGFTGGLCSQFTFQNNKELNCNIAGTYRVDWQMSRSVPGANQEIEGGVMKNGTILTNTTAHTQSTVASTQQSFSGSGIVNLAVNDVISLAVNNNTGTNTITITHANLTVHRVGS